MKTMKTTKTQILEALDALQVWFASKPYGFTERCSPDQLQQYRDREREEQYLIERLETLNG